MTDDVEIERLKECLKDMRDDLQEILLKNAKMYAALKFLADGRRKIESDGTFKTASEIAQEALNDELV